MLQLLLVLALHGSLLPATPDGEYAVAAHYLNSGRFSQDEINNIRFFTTYAVPEKLKIRDEDVQLRSACEHSLAFVLNSVMSVNAFGNRIVKPKAVPGSDTLFYIDIADFGWSREDIDAVFKQQPYFLSPLVDGDNTVIMFRADWFVTYVSDVTRADDRGIKDIPYYILLYGKGKEPKDADDFRKAWQVDLKTIKAQKVNNGTIVDAGESGVSNHTRQLEFGRTVFGHFSQTKDVKSHDIDPDKIQSRDYIEDIFANQVDAGEYIATHKNGLQVYFLSNGTNQGFKRVESGDTGVVVARPLKDVRVRTGYACMVCHMNGYIPYTNAIKDLFRNRGRIDTYSKELKREIEQFYLDSDGSEVQQNNFIFERAVKKCNGLTPEDNVKALVDVYDWYSGKVTISQAAVECGLTPDDLKKTIKVTTTGRLTQLYRNTTIPRDVWDSINNGGYVQVRLLQKRVDRTSPPQPVAAKPPPPVIELQVPTSVEVAVVNTPITDVNGEILVYLGKGITVEVLKAFPDHYAVRYGRYQGYIKKQAVKLK